MADAMSMKQNARQRRLQAAEERRVLGGPRAQPEPAAPREVPSTPDALESSVAPVKRKTKREG